jgi:hypothetical protein
LMASVGWFRDLMMLGFALLLLVVTGLLLTETDFALMPLAGSASLLPTSLIITATLCMSWSLVHWTNLTWRRAFKGLVISLSACWITALACIQGMTHREGVFLRTSKTGSDKRRLRKALRLTRVETVLAFALFGSAGALIVSADPPLLLIAIMILQGSVYLCAPVAALWNIRAQRVPEATFRQRFAEQQARKARKRQPKFATAGFALALFAAVVAGAIVAIYALPTDTAPVPAATIAPIDGVGGTGS